MQATLVSFYPREFDEYRGSIYPSGYFIPASNGKIPELLTIEDPFHMVENLTGSDRPPIKIFTSAPIFAESLIYDFRNSCIETAPGAYPAIFSVPEKITENDVFNRFQSRMNEAIEAQKRWFELLIRRADDDWQRYRQHKLINDLQRSAAHNLGMEREWLMILKDVTNCPACKVRVDPDAIICSNCRCILNQKLYEKLHFAGTGVEK